jgi:hypothetical protein
LQGAALLLGLCKVIVFFIAGFGFSGVRHGAALDFSGVVSEVPSTCSLLLLLLLLRPYFSSHAPHFLADPGPGDRN